MSHTIREKTKLVNRVRRIQGQVTSVLAALEAEAECSDVLQRIAAARGALGSLMSEVLEGHIRQHSAQPGSSRAAREEFANELVAVVRSYLK